MLTTPFVLFRLLRLLYSDSLSFLRLIAIGDPRSLKRVVELARFGPFTDVRVVLEGAILTLLLRSRHPVTQLRLRWLQEAILELSSGEVVREELFLVGPIIGFGLDLRTVLVDGVARLVLVAAVEQLVHEQLVHHVTARLGLDGMLLVDEVVRNWDRFGVLLDLIGILAVSHDVTNFKCQRIALVPHFKYSLFTQFYSFILTYSCFAHLLKSIVCPVAKYLLLLSLLNFLDFFEIVFRFALSWSCTLVLILSIDV